MPLLRPSPRPIFRLLQTRTYATAATPAIKVTIVPAPHCGSIRILSLNRPAARNAISRQLLAELSHQINSIHNEGDNGSTRALILASDVDSSFCAGADLKERATFTTEEYVFHLKDFHISKDNDD
jgi:methylglutaconyl-CoA hydratase